MAVRVTVAGSSREWWARAHADMEAGRAPAAMLPLLNGLEGEVTVDTATWRQLQAWAASIPGWTESDDQEQLSSEFDIEG